MIFKTIISDINKVALAMDSLKNISQFNTGSTIANGMALSESAIISYQTAIDGLSLSQAQAALSSTALTDAQKEQILTSAGLLQSTQAITLEEVKQMASSASLSAQKKEEILTTLQGAYSENEWNMERLEAIAASGGEAGAIAQSMLAKKAENAENVKGVASNKALTASLWEQLKARLALFAANPVAWIAGVAAVSVGLIALQKKFTKSLDECTEELSNFNSEVENAQSEADSLQTEWETCQKRLGELQKLADNGTISIIEQEEYERLLKTNDELERNIRIQKEKTQLSAMDAANSADETLSKTVESKYKTSWQDYTGMGVATEQASWITPEEELSASIEEYKRLQTEIDRLKVSYDKGNISAEEYNTQLTDLTNQQTDARNRASEMSDILVESEQAYTNLTNTGAELTTTQTANYNSVKQANAAYNDFLGTINGVDSAFENLDTTEKAQSLKNKYAAKTVSLPNGQGTYTVEDKEISDWIDTLPDEDLTVLASINFSGEQTKDSMQEALDYAKNNVNGNINETDILSFSDAWNSEDFEDARKELLSLAEAGQLTPETLQSTEEYKKLLEQTGMSAEEAAKKINSMTDASTQLQSMSAQISKMSDMLADKKNGTVASASDLAGFDATVKGLESWEEFERVMGSTTSTMEECQAAANALATEWINNGNYLANLTEENKDYYQTQLSNMGIENAAAIVTDTLAAKKIAEKYAIEDLSDATKDEISVKYQEIAALVKEGEVSGTTASALYNLIYQQTIFSNQNLDVYGKISALQELALAFGITADAALGASQAINLENQLRLAKHYGATDAQVNTYAAQLTSKMQDAIKAQFGSISTSISPIGSGNYKPSGGSGSGSGSDTKQTIDWIERKISSLNDNIDLTQSKLDNLFNIKTPKGLSKQITDVSNRLKKASDNTDKWKSKLSKIKIPDSVKKLIQGGKDVNLSKYSKTEQKNIKKYQSTWKSYSSAKKKENSLYNQKWDLQTQKGKETLLKSQEKDYNTLAKIEEKAYKKYMSKAKSVKLSSSLKKKVQSGDYKISDYSSKTQSLIQEYQDWWDKAQDANKGKYEAKKNAKDKRIERYQLYVDDAEAKIAKSQALAALQEGNYKKQNKRLEGQKKYLREQYEAQIKIAEAEENTLEVERLRAELLKELRDKTKEQFDNIDATYSMKIGFTDNKVKAFQDQISLLEAQGQQIGSRLYTKQMELNQLNINKLNTERRKQIKKVDEFGVGTPEWYEAQDAIFATERALKQYEIEQANLQKAINQLKFDRFDNLLDKLNDIVDETDFLISMLDSDNFFDDNGNMTSDGVTAMGLTVQNYDTYLAQAEKYKQMLSDVKDMYDARKISLEEYEEYQRKYSQSQRNAIKSANDAKKSIIDYVKQGLDAQNNALSEAINKQKELLQSEKDLKDFQDRLADSNKSIADIQKQINALESDNSESNRKKLQQLRSDLANAQKDQEDLLYDRSISDQEDALDQMLKNSQEQAENYLKDSEKVFVDALAYVNAHTQQVSNNLEQISKETGYDISENITNAWKDAGKAVDSYENILTGNVPNITSQIQLITTAWQNACDAAEKASKAIVNATEEKYVEHTTEGADAKVLSDIEWYIQKNGVAPKNKPSSYSPLNQYIYEKTGKVIAEDKQAGLAKILGITGLSKDTSATERAKILKALKAAGFSNGGFVNIKDAIRYSGEDGLALVRNDECILSPKQTDGFLSLAEHAPQLAESLKNMTLPQFSYPQIDRNIPIANRTPTVVNNTFDNRVTVEGVATDKIVKDFENVATKQAENVVAKINSMAYAKGVRHR